MHKHQPQIHFDTFANALQDAVVVLDAEMRIQCCNKLAEDLLKIYIPDSYGKNITDILQAEKFQRYIQAQDKSEPLKLCLQKNPALWLQITLLPYTEQQHLLIARDITHLHQLEKMRQDFVANVSHELRTPLTVIKGYLESMNDNREQFKDAWHSIFAQMLSQSDRMELLLQDLLLLSRLETDTPETSEHVPVSMAGLLTSICEDARALSGTQQHQISLQLEDNIDLIGEANELRNAFSNLVFNAVRYSPPGAQITVSWYQDEHGAHVAVRDTGGGIDSKHIPRLTERFYRIDKGRSRAGGGTGLGLAIVKHVLLRHNADLHIESELGVGSLFRCDFPLQKLSV